MDKLINCLIVEDEPLAQDVLKLYIDDCPGLQLKACFDNALEANEYLNSHPIDLIFLDINMPRLSGISFAKSLSQKPAIIFCTAYPEFAVEGFELEALDYLLKPFSFERFLKAVNKLKKQLSTRDIPSTEVTNKLVVRADKKLYPIDVSHILFIEALGDYIKLHTLEKTLVVYETLKSIFDQLPSAQFIRVHKSYIIALAHVDYVEGNRIFIQKQEIPIGGTYKESVQIHFQ